MGCTSSSWNEVRETQISEKLTERQIQVIKDTWDLMSEDMEGTGVIIFNRLFQTDKELKSLFVNLLQKEDSTVLNAPEPVQANTADGKPNGTGTLSSVHLDELLLKKHAHVVMEALGAAVECLEDSVFLSNVLIALGQIHGTYHVKAMYLPRLWPAIRHGLKEVLQDVFTEQVEDCWRIVFNFIISKMKEGIRLEKHHLALYQAQQQRQQQTQQQSQQQSTVSISNSSVKSFNPEKQSRVQRLSMCRRESILSIRESVSAEKNKRKGSKVAPMLDTGQENKESGEGEGTSEL